MLKAGVRGSGRPLCRKGLRKPGGNGQLNTRQVLGEIDVTCPVPSGQAQPRKA